MCLAVPKIVHIDDVGLYLYLNELRAPPSQTQRDGEAAGFVSVQPGTCPSKAKLHMLTGPNYEMRQLVGYFAKYCMSRKAESAD